MNNKIRYSIYFVLVVIISVSIGVQSAFSQTSDLAINGVVVESGSGKALQQVSVSEIGGVGTSTNENGEFSIKVSSNQAEISVQLPGYTRRQIFLNGRTELTISLVQDIYSSFDREFNGPLTKSVLKDEIYAVTDVNADELKYKNVTSFEQALQGIVPGLNVISHSGLPGQKSWLSIRGVNSLFCRNEPLLMVDGLIHDYNYANISIMEGYSLNPFDLIDIDDISGITVLRNGDSYLGAASSNGLIYVNTEMKSEVGTVIRASAQTGVSLVPAKLDLLNSSQFRDYFVSHLASQGYSKEMMETSYPWLIGEGVDKYKYDNSTDWQDELFKPGILQKYHIFLKGGDDIATYNISVGYLLHDGSYNNSSYNRFNLRVNGIINITNRFSVAPNVKLSLSDSYVPNQGPTVQRNPLISALQKSPLMAPNARDALTGETLQNREGEGDFNISNPMSLVDNATGSNRNYHFMSSIKLNYQFSQQLAMSYLIGINFNNARESIFIPDKGVVKIDSANNSPMEFINEFRSTQHNIMLNYVDVLSNGTKINLIGGARYFENLYINTSMIDLNTATDDFSSLGDGSTYSYLRQSFGDNRNLAWASIYANGNYSIADKYILNANLSLDGSSVINKLNRYSLYPSLGGAWRLSSEEFLVGKSGIEDLKLRASWSLSGNMYGSAYDYSNLYYTEIRRNELGAITREAIPNENLEIEKTSMFNLGIDFSGKHQALNAHLDLYYSNVNNLMIEQKLPQGYGFTTYYDNGGKLSNMGAELAIDYRKHFSNIVWVIGGTAATNFSTVTDLAFIAAGQKNIITKITGAEYITSKGGSVNAFYGFKTNGVFTNDDEASKVIGPNGSAMKAGDLKYVDNGDGIINDEDKGIIGDPNALLFGGLFTSVKYKNWELKAMFKYNVGGDLYNYVRSQTESMDTYANQRSTVTDRWTPENSSSDMPRLLTGDASGNTVFSDRWIEDGSYLKLKQLTLNYNMPSSGLYSRMDVYLTVSNLFTLTKYSGYDPEFYYLNNPFYMGVDYGKMPQSRSFIIGIKIDL